MHTWATIKTRWTSFLGTVGALALGVAIVTAALLVHVSAEPSVPARYAETGVLVHGALAEPGSDGYRAPVPWPAERTAELSGKLARVDGVSQVVADHSFYAQAVLDGEPAGDPRADPQGHGWSSTLLGGHGLTEGSAPAAPGEIAVGEDLGVETGTALTVLTASGPAVYEVTGLVDGEGYYLTDAEAAKLADGVTVLGLLTAPGADTAAVDDAATALVGGDGAALHGDERAAFEPESHTRTRWLGTQLLTAMTMLSAFAAVFVVASTFAFGVAQRRRELGLMRTIGATPGQIRRMLFGEALGVGLIASAIGVVLGLALAPVLGGLLVDAELEPPDFAIHVEAWPLLTAGGVGMVVAFLGVWAASRRAARVRPMEALREAAVDARPMTRGRWILGALALAGGVVSGVVASSASAEDLLNYSMLSAVALIVGLTLYSPVIIPPVVRLAAWPFTGAKGATWTVVRESTLVAVRRVASTAAPVLVTVGFVVLLAGMVQTMKGAMGTDLAAKLPAEVVVQPEGTPGLSDAAVDGLPGEALPVMTVDAFHEGEPFTVTGLVTDLPADAVRIARPYMETLGLSEGDPVTLTFPDGEATTLKVVAGDDGETDGPGAEEMYPTAVVVERETLRELAPNALTEVVYLNGVTVGDAEPALSGLGAIALDTETFARHADEREWELLRVFMLVLLIMAIGYTALAIANTLIMANADRLKDFAVLRLSGAGNGQVLKIVAVETILVVAVGTGLGLLVAVAALEGVRRGLESQIGADVSMAIPWDYVGAVIVASLVLALGASLLTARTALRVPAVRLAGMKE
ncbi:FtsX-like permease family protein [Phytomonospora sp. NPDC050363]|uniref:FtsX-like permease family protein n=1 Tax=Phytomonospora sp. NPDC050363 TaxID=3155642 RepID=UPI00340F12CB